MADISTVVGGERISDITPLAGGVRFPAEADLVARFSDWYEPYHQISPHRARVRRRVMEDLIVHVGGPITQLTAQDLEEFLGSREHAPATILRELKMLRPWFKWCWQHGHITADQLMRLQDVKAPRGAGIGKPRPYTHSQLAEMWEDFDAAYPWSREERLDHQTPRRGEYWTSRWQRGASVWEKARPYARRLQAEAIIALLLFGGLRARECFDLELSDMHYENAFVRVHGARKNTERVSYERPVPITEQMAVALANWIEYREQVIKPDTDRPWLHLWDDDRKCEPMSFTAFGQLLVRVGPGYKMHRLRHTFATERLRAGMPLETLQMVLGHANINQTRQYVSVSDDDVIRVAEKSNVQFAATVQRQHEIMR